MSRQFKILYWMTALCLMPFYALATDIPTSAPKPPLANQQLAHDIFKQLVEIRSVHDVGTKAAAEALAERFKTAGFASRDVILLPEDQYPHQVNLVVHLHGRGKGKPILWLCHLDVVEARPADWSLPPFQFIEKDGYFYGRGTADMKDEDAAVAASLIRLKQEGFVPDHDIIVAFTADEEVGEEQDGADFLFRHHRNLVDAGLVINPDTGSGEIVNGKRQDFGIETNQKIDAIFLLEVTNKGGHGSEPRPDNAIYTLANGLIKLSHYQFPFVVSSSMRLYFQRMASVNTGQTSKDMLAVARDKPDFAAATRLAKNVSLNAKLHTTCIPTMLSGGHQENALPQKATATVQCRIEPSETIEGTRAAIVKAIDDPEIKVKLNSDMIIGRESLLTPKTLTSVEKVVHSMWPGVIVIPQMVPWGTDSSITRNLGIPSYGIGGGWNDINDIRWHGKDERHEINDFYSSVEFTYRLMKELSTKSAPGK